MTVNEFKALIEGIQLVTGDQPPDEQLWQSIVGYIGLLQDSADTPVDIEDYYAGTP